MKAKTTYTLVSLLFLFVSASCSISQNVVCSEDIAPGTWKYTVELNDGTLHFEEKGHDMWTSVSYATPDSCKRVEIKSEEFAAYLNFDPRSLAALEGFPTRVAPSEEDLNLDVYKVQRDDVYTMQLDLYGRGDSIDYVQPAGSFWGGVSYVISEPFESKWDQSYKMAVYAAKETEYLLSELAAPTYAKAPNSMVGEIPVFASHRHITTSLDSMGYVPLEEFVALFTVGGYRYLVISKGFEQSEFVATVLAIINHYGAYPSRAGN